MRCWWIRQKYASRANLFLCLKDEFTDNCWWLSLLFLYTCFPCCYDFHKKKPIGHKRQLRKEGTIGWPRELIDKHWRRERNTVCAEARWRELLKPHTGWNHVPGHQGHIVFICEGGEWRGLRLSWHSSPITDSQRNLSAKTLNAAIHLSDICAEMCSAFNSSVNQLVFINKQTSLSLSRMSNRGKMNSFPYFQLNDTFLFKDWLIVLFLSFFHLEREQT